MSSSDDEKPKMESSSSKIRSSKNAKVAFKLDGRNYPLWSRLMKVAIGSRGGYSHITGKPAPPLEGSKEYDDWEETDLIVFSWIVDNIENDIIADFAHHQTAKAIWENLRITYENEADQYLAYDLEDKANMILQGETDLETYYRRIHGIWTNVDRCQKSPITCCDKGVSQYRTHSNTKRLFKFLAGLNEMYEPIRRDILKESPLPSVEAAYGWIKKEAARRKIMPPSPSPAGDSHGSADTSSGGIGHGLAAQRQQRGSQRPPANHRPGNKPIDKTKLWCDACRKPRHTRETCFKIIGFPDWWEERQAGRAQMAVGIARKPTGIPNRRRGHGTPSCSGRRRKTGDCRSGSFDQQRWWRRRRRRSRKLRRENESKPD